MTKKRREHSAEFKREAVSLVVDQGYSMAEAGRSLGVSGAMIGRWWRELEAVQSGERSPGGKLSPEQQRIKELEAENRRLRMEKEILKRPRRSSCRKNHEVSIYRYAQERLAHPSHV